MHQQHSMADGGLATSDVGSELAKARANIVQVAVTQLKGGTEKHFVYPQFLRNYHHTHRVFYEDHDGTVDIVKLNLAARTFWRTDILALMD